MGEADGPAGHAFISYVREDSREVDRLQRILESAGIRVWRDTTDLWPGQDWRARIREAITGDALVFIACFSCNSAARETSYQNQELVLAVDQLVLRRPDVPWLIPVRFDDCQIPDLPLGAGRTLRSIQRADLFGESYDQAASRLVRVILQILGSRHGAQIPAPYSEAGERVSEVRRQREQAGQDQPTAERQRQEPGNAIKETEPRLDETTSAQATVPSVRTDGVPSPVQEAVIASAAPTDLPDASLAVFASGTPEAQATTRLPDMTAAARVKPARAPGVPAQVPIARRLRWRAAGLMAVALISALVFFVAGDDYHGGPAGGVAPARGSTAAKTWSVTRNGPSLQIGYGSGVSFPQYAALQLDSGYFRMIYSPAVAWGTSVDLLPALWSRTSCPADYCQGAPVSATWRESGARLVLSIRGTIATLTVKVAVTLAPPADGALVVGVSATVTGAVKLDSNRPWEAYKPVMLLSTYDSPTVWDSRDAFTGTVVYPFPPQGWIIKSPVITGDFGLQGGTSRWKTNTPTIEVVLDQSLPVTGWTTQMSNPEEENVAFWCAASKVLTSWSYTVTAEKGSQL